MVVTLTVPRANGAKYVWEVSAITSRNWLKTRGDRIHFTRGVRREMFEPEHAIHAHPSFKVRFEHQLKTAMDRSFESALYSGMTPFGSVSLVG